METPDPRFVEARRILEQYDRSGRLLSPEQLRERSNTWGRNLAKRRRNLEHLRESLQQMDANLAEEQKEWLANRPSTNTTN